MLEHDLANVNSIPMRRHESEETANASGSGGHGVDGPRGWKRIAHSLQKHSAPNAGSPPPTAFGFLSKHDPDDYLHARKKLKKAVLECYR